MSTLPAQYEKTLQVLPPGLGTRKPSVTWVSKVEENCSWRNEEVGRESVKVSWGGEGMERKINLHNKLASLG